jgi:hypothetical protein
MGWQEGRKMRAQKRAAEGQRAEGSNVGDECDREVGRMK